MTARQQLYLPAVAPLGASSPTWYTAAWLTLPTEPSRPELQVLLHGAGYDHRYWDWPVEPENYSYAAWAAARGIATLNLDRIGSGASSRPPGAQNTQAAQAQVVSQIIAAARAGLPGAPPFERVVLVGHSLGSVVAGLEAATYGDPDAVVLTGYIPVDGTSESEEALFDAAFMPAVEAMPHLLGLVDGDYLTSRSFGRAELLFHQEAADPAIVAVDARLQGITSRGELRGSGPAGTVIRAGAVPTLVLAGQHDVLLLDRGQDKDTYDTTRRWAARSPAHFDFEVVAGSGHNLNLHRAAHQAYEAIESWLAARAAAPAV
jgi:pimeloyl-ACP methyl ester carboxylesterase